MTRTLAGYTDRISACPGETIEFKVSAEDGSARREQIVAIVKASPGRKRSSRSAVASSQASAIAASVEPGASVSAWR